MTKAKIMICACVVLAFAAGVSVGMLVMRSKGPHEPGSWLSRELNLTSQQQEQMRQIWSDIMRTAGEQHWQRGRELQEERDKAVQALLTEEQKQQYAKLMEDHAKKLEELSQERKKRFEEAVEKTKQILTAEQRAKYEELMAKRPVGPHRGPRGGGPPVPPPPAPGAEK